MGRELAPGLWVFDGEPIRFLGFPYALRMTVVRLPDGGLWLHSPVQPLPQRRRAVEALGPVRWLISPNKLHHLFLGQWAAAYPEARLLAPPGLARRRRDLRFHAELGDEPDPAWAEVLDQRLVPGSWFMNEVLFFHRASGTLLVGDLIENHDPAAFGPWQRRVAGWNRMLAPHGETPRNYRWSFWRRAGTRAALRDVLAWRPERVVMMHGPIVETDAVGFLERAWAWVL